MGIPMLRIRRSGDRLSFNMRIPIHGKDGLYIGTGPRSWDFQFKHSCDSYSIKVADNTMPRIIMSNYNNKQPANTAHEIYDSIFTSNNTKKLRQSKIGCSVHAIGGGGLWYESYSWSVCLPWQPNVWYISYAYNCCNAAHYFYTVAFISI